MLEDTDASSYFETSNKIKRTAVPPRKARAKNKTKDDDFVVDDDDFEFDEDLMQEIESSQPTKAPTTNGSHKDKPKSSPTKTVTAAKKDAVKKTSTKRKVDVVSSEDEFLDPKPVPKDLKPVRVTPKKSKSSESTLTAKKDEIAPTKKTPTNVAPKPAPKTTKKSEPDEAEDDLGRKAILDSIETVALPDTEPADETKYTRLILILT